MEAKMRRYSASFIVLPNGASTKEIPSLCAPSRIPLPPSVFPSHLPPDKNDIDELGYSLGKQLKALSPDFKSSINADARDVAARPRNARYDSLTNRISGQGYNWNCARSCFEL